MEINQNFTMLVNKEFTSVYDKMIETDNEPYLAATKITHFLSKNNMHMTAGRFLCRYIKDYLAEPDRAKNLEKQLEEHLSEEESKEILKAITTTFEWDKKTIKAVSDFLAEDTDISKVRWVALLSRGNLKKAVDRAELYHVIFTLHMNNETAAKFLLLNGAGLPSYRNPIDFVCLAHLAYSRRGHEREAVSWLRMKDTIEAYIDEVQILPDTQKEVKKQYKEGPRNRDNTSWLQTKQLKTEMDIYMDSIVGVYYKDFSEAVLQFMKNSRDNFFPIKLAGREDFLYVTENPYSVTSALILKQLLRYLTVLYPTCRQTASKYDDIDKVKSYLDIRKYDLTEDHLPVNLNNLISALLESVDWAAPEKKSEEETVETNDASAVIAEELKFVDAACKRLYAKVNNTLNVIDNKAVGAYIDRDDIVLLSYFLISAYIQYYNDENCDIGALIDELRTIPVDCSDDEIDPPIEKAMDDAVALLVDTIDEMGSEDLSDSDQIQYIRECYDAIIDAFNKAYGITEDFAIHHIYLPSPMDQFCVLAAMAPNNREVAELLFNAANMSDAEMDYDASWENEELER